MTTTSSTNELTISQFVPATPGSFATDTNVVIDFEPAEGGTYVRLRHAGFANAAQRDNHNEGWTGCLGNLARLY